MPEINVSIGGRLFEVACQDGEEHFLRTAAAMLDAEAAVLMEQIGRMPEARMLLMAGLMLADKTAAVEDQIREMNGRVEELEAALAEAHANPVRVEVPVIPEIIFDTFAEIAARAEALAESIEERTSDPYALAEAGFAAGDVEAADTDAAADGAEPADGTEADDAQDAGAGDDAVWSDTMLIEEAALAATPDLATRAIRDDVGRFAGPEETEDTGHYSSSALNDAESGLAHDEAAADPEGAEGEGLGDAEDALGPEVWEDPAAQDDFGGAYPGGFPAQAPEDAAVAEGEDAPGDERHDEDMRR